VARLAGGGRLGGGRLGGGRLGGGWLARTGLAGDGLAGDWLAGAGLLGVGQAAPSVPQVDVVERGPGRGDAVHADPGAFQRGQHGWHSGGAVIRPGADPVPVNLDLAYRRDLAEGGVHLACVPGGGQVDVSPRN
jgi:hypothetical protein